MSSERRTAMMTLLVCPACHEALNQGGESLSCRKCGFSYPIKNDVPRFVTFSTETTGDSGFQADQMFDTTFTAKLFNAGKKIITSEYLPRDQVREFVSRILPGQAAVELGSGNRRLREDIMTLDLFAFPNVDIAADVARTPFSDNSVDCIILDSVLEHVPDPFRVVAECFRILKPGGRVISVTPFVFPYHGYPKHFYNFSEDGLLYMFRDFSERNVEMNLGPTSALTNFISEYVAVALSGKSKLWYTFWKGLALVPVFWLKYLDKLWAKSGNAKRIASHLCLRAVK